MNKSYVLRAARFTEAQKKAYDLLSEKFVIPVNTINPDVSPVTFIGEKLNFNKIFGNTAGVTMEIGFGSGAATAELAQVNPGKNYLGVEVHRPGIGRLLWEINKRSLLNIRIIEYDVVPVAEKMIPAGSLEAVHLFFPDPWQKKKHRKRRLVQRPFTNTLAECLKPGGYLYMVTDWEDYAHHALEELSATTGFLNINSHLDEGFSPPLTWRPVTKFEQKGLVKNHSIKELYFVKI